MSKRRIYICGPMAGHLDYNYPAFNAAALKVRGLMPEAEIVNPAANFEEDKGVGYPPFCRWSLGQVMRATDLYVLSGWFWCPRSTAEVKMARLLGLKIWFVTADGDFAVRIDCAAGSKEEGEIKL